jgi:hypothetical protein
MKNIELATPTAMSATGRSTEITSILANAIIRTQLAEHEAHSAKQREVGLGFLPNQRVHTTPYQTEKLK